MKKLLITLLITLTLFSLVACTTSKKTSTKEVDTYTVSETKGTIHSPLASALKKALEDN